MSIQQVMASFGSAGSSPSEPNPYIWYTFDNTLADAMGNNSNATRGAGGAYTTGDNGFGGSGEATVFNGNANSVVTIPTFTINPHPAGQCAYTVEFCVYPTAGNGSTQRELFYYSYLATQSFGALFYDSSVKKVSYYQRGSQAIQSSVTISDNAWTRIRFVHEDGVSDRLYFDTGSGFTLVGSESGTHSNEINVSLNSPKLGYNFNAFFGRIDEFKVWREAVIPS